MSIELVTSDAPIQRPSTVIGTPALTGCCTLQSIGAGACAGTVLSPFPIYPTCMVFGLKVVQVILICPFVVSEVAAS